VGYTAGGMNALRGFCSRLGACRGLLGAAVLGGALMCGVPGATTAGPCTAPTVTQIGGPEGAKPHANSFAPKGASRRRAYGAPIQAPILHRRPASHRHHPAPAPHSRQAPAPAVR